MSKKRWLSNRLEYMGWILSCAVVRLLSRRAAIRIADCMGWLLWRVGKVRKQVVLENLHIAFGGVKSEKEIDRIALESIQSCILTFIEFLHPELVGELYGDVLQTVDEPENGLALVDKQGLCLLAHIGNWEVQGKIPAHYGVKYRAFAKPMHNPLVNKAIVEQRRKIGINLIFTNRTNVEVADAIKHKEWIAFLGDQDASSRGIFVNFFGKAASTFKGAGFYSWKFGLPILPLFTVRLRDKNRTLKVICRPPIYPDTNADRDTEILRLTQAHTAVLESVIKEYPESYFWLHRRWKSQKPE
ncbi:hypothetical protein GX645_05440 [Candidatus Sumerlaeota bacterium]|nr:hypothetical protein [Candidatus Sumerlaeota bacterium]